YDSVSVRRSGAGAAVAIAPVGHARAHSSHAVQRLAWTTGKPNAAGTPNGSASVRTPPVRFFARIRNTAPSSIVPRVRQVEALVDHREVRHDVAGHGVRQPGPVQEARV